MSTNISNADLNYIAQGLRAGYLMSVNPAEIDFALAHAVVMEAIKAFRRYTGSTYLEANGRPTKGGPLDRAVVSAMLAKQRPEPVADHAFEGDGYDNASICSCGRHREDHLRFR